MKWKTRYRMIDLSERGVVMGIVNATSDSFSDGGEYVGEKAVQRALALEADGAEIVDIGGESTRPGATAVTEVEELERVIPVIEGVRKKSDVLISIDTSKAEVARQAIVAGADIVNDVTGCRGDAKMVEVCVEAGVGVVVMHMQGNPRTMQISPEYDDDDVVAAVRVFFEDQYDALTSAGMEPEALCFDPGIGFGKRHEDNMKLLNNLGAMSVRERPLMLGVSRKSLIGKALGIEEPSARDAATTGMTVHGRMAGCMLHRVHAVRENVEAMRMVEEVMRYE